MPYRRLPLIVANYVQPALPPPLPVIHVRAILQDDPTARHVAEQLAAHVSTHGFVSAMAPGAVGAVLGRDMALDQAVRKSKEVHVGEMQVRLYRALHAQNSRGGAYLQALHTSWHKTVAATH